MIAFPEGASTAENAIARLRRLLDEQGAPNRRDCRCLPESSRSDLSVPDEVTAVVTGDAERSSTAGNVRAKSFISTCSTHLDA